MLLKNSISKTKKFFQRTIHSFRSFMSNGGNYHILPKTPPFNPFSCNPRRRGASCASHDMSYNELDKLYTDFTTGQWDNAADHNEDKATVEKMTSPAAETKQQREEEEQDEEKCSSPRIEKRANLVAEKLKEMVMMDVGDVEHVLDIEEVLHYYSRLTCPAYLDIVDKFFIDMYSEFIDQPPLPTRGIVGISRMRPRYR